MTADKYPQSSASALVLLDLGKSKPWAEQTLLIYLSKPAAQRNILLQALHADATAMNSNFNAYPQDVLKAESFTDVLANVANDWIPQDPSSTWGGSFMVGGDWNFSTKDQEQNGMSQGQSCLPDTSSNNSAEKAKGVQVGF